MVMMKTEVTVGTGFSLVPIPRKSTRDQTG